MYYNCDPSDTLIQQLFFWFDSITFELSTCVRLWAKIWMCLFLCLWIDSYNFRFAISTSSLKRFCKFFMLIVLSFAFFWSFCPQLRLSYSRYKGAVFELALKFIKIARNTLFWLLFDFWDLVFSYVSI